MADYLHDDVLDNGLSSIPTVVEYLYICSAMPTTYAEAQATYALGNKAAPSIGAVGDRTGGGRKVTVAAISDGAVTADGTAGYYALTDNSLSKLIAAGALASSQGVSNGNTFTLTAFDIGIPDAV